MIAVERTSQIHQICKLVILTGESFGYALDIDDYFATASIRIEGHVFNVMIGEYWLYEGASQVHNCCVDCLGICVGGYRIPSRFEREHCHDCCSQVSDTTSSSQLCLCGCSKGF
jgi:hypothetical protein